MKGGGFFLEKISSYFPEIYIKAIQEVQQGGYWTELFLRVGQPAIFYVKGREYTLLKHGGLYCREMTSREIMEQTYIVTKKDIYDILQKATNATPIAYQEEIGQGYLTLEGGHRLGFAGQVIADKTKVYFKHINGMMLRIAKERKGCADKVLPFLLHNQRVYNTLVISPPACGKTTFLRDCARQLSNGSDLILGKKTAVIDERMEIAAASGGIPQFDVGRRTNVISGCNKELAFVMAVRSLSPEILIADEIGFQEESRALLYGIYSGCSVICSTHGYSVDEVKERNSLKELFKESIFARYVILEKENHIYKARVYDSEGHLLYE